MARCTSAAATARVDAAAERADDPAGADLGPHRGDLLVDDRRHRPRPARTRRARAGTSAAPASRSGVCTTSGWHCTPQIRRSSVLHRRDRRVGRGRRWHTKPVRRHGDRVEVAHPHVLLVGQCRPSSVDSPVTGDLRPAVLAAQAAADGAAELLGDELRAVADAEDRDAEVVDGRDRATGAPSTCTLFGPPREDDRRRRVARPPRRR